MHEQIKNVVDPNPATAGDNLLISTETAIPLFWPKMEGASHDRNNKEDTKGKRPQGFIVDQFVFCELTALTGEWQNDDPERRQAKGQACSSETLDVGKITGCLDRF